MQKRSTNFKEAWAEFCKVSGGGTYDPAKHESAFLIRFFDTLASPQQGDGSVGSLAVANVMSSIVGDASRGVRGGFEGWGNKDSGKGGWTPTWAAGRSGNGGYASEMPPAKRARTDIVVVPPAIVSGGRAQPVWGGSGRLEHGSIDYLVAQVKAFQRLDPQAKELWSQYADTYLGGVRDPARHDVNTLAEFCAAHEVPQLPPQASPQGGGGGGGGGHYQPPPVAPGAPMDAAKEALVVRVKAFQKASKDHSELWRQFCGQHFDPARHPSEKLQEFLAMYAAP